MFREQPLHKKLCFAGGVTLVMLGCFIAASFGENSTGLNPVRPPIAWTPSSLITTVSAGGSNTLNLSFVASQNLTNVGLRVVPELQPYVQVVPSNVPAITSGHAVTIIIRVATPATMLPQTISGAIQARDDQQGRTIATPLPVSLTVQWQRLQEAALDFSVAYPPTYIPTVNKTSGLEEVGFSENQDAYSAGLAPVFVITSEPLPGGQSLRGWIHSFGVADVNITEVTAGTTTYLKWFESGGEGDGNAFSYSVVAPNGNVVTVTLYSAGLIGSPAFDVILSSLTFTTP